MAFTELFVDHTGRGGIAERFFGTRHHTWLRSRLETWAADPRTTIPLLRRALQEAVDEENLGEG